MEGTTKSAALEAAAFGVRVNAVAPGPTETAMLNRFTGTPERKAALVSSVPLGRVGAPEEIARLADAPSLPCFREINSCASSKRNGPNANGPTDPAIGCADIRTRIRLPLAR